MKRCLRFAALLWLAVVLAAGAFVSLRFAASKPIETDLLTLLPPTEKNATAEIAVRTLSEQLGNRVLFLVGHADATQAATSARRFATELESSGTFARIVVDAPRTDPQLITDLYAPYRIGLLTSSDRDALSRPDYPAESVLLRRLHQPFQTSIATDLGTDPFGFLQRWLGKLPLMQTRLGVYDGLLTVRDDRFTWILLLAEPRGGAFETATQANIVHATASAEKKLAAETQGLTVLRAGALFYGEAARTSAEREVDLIGGGSLVGIVLMMWLLFRSVRPLALSLFTVACGIVCAVAAVLAAQERIHLITLVFGASLIGEAVDYAIQYFAARLDAGQTWQTETGLRRLLPGLATALATSLIGYGALILTPFPAIGQIALFAFAGLASAWLSVVLFLPFLSREAVHYDTRKIRLPHHLLQIWQSYATPRRLIALIALAMLAALPGWLRLAADDDIRQLIARPAALVAQEERIRELAAAGGGTRFFVVEGHSEEEALTREEALTSRLSTQIGQSIVGYTAISDYVPSAATQSENQRLIKKTLTPEKVKHLFSTTELRPSVIRQWEKTLGESQTLTLQEWISTPIANALRHQILRTANGGTALIVTLTGDKGIHDLAALAEGLPGVIVVNKTASVSALFAEYRRLTACWLPFAALIVLGVLIWRYGLRQGSAILLPTLIAMGVALGIYGWLGVPLTLFALLALILVLSVGVNYAIFMVEAGDQAPAPFAGVLLSAATTLLSFGLLTLSSLPALHQFGLLLLCGITTAVVLAPMALTFGARR